MTSETSDEIQLNTRLDIDESQGADPNVQGISVGFVRLDRDLHRLPTDEYDVFIKAKNYSPDDDGARVVAEQLIMAGESILQKLQPVDPEDERIIQELIKEGMPEEAARTVGLRSVKQLIGSRLPMHPQDPERWASVPPRPEEISHSGTHRPDIRSFETPQHVLDDRAARKAARKAKGFNPRPAKGGE